MMGREWRTGGCVIAERKTRCGTGGKYQWGSEAQQGGKRREEKVIGKRRRVKRGRRHGNKG